MKKITEQELFDKGYIYLGEYGAATKDHQANQLWRWRDELILYDPEAEMIIWREFNEPRFQHAIINPQPCYNGRRA